MAGKKRQRNPNRLAKYKNHFPITEKNRTKRRAKHQEKHPNDKK
jgi:hypothetical protein